MSKDQKDDVVLQVGTNDFVVEIGRHKDQPYIDYIKLDERPDDDKQDVAEIESSKNSEIENLNFRTLLNAWADSCHGFLDAFPLFSSVTHYVKHSTSGDELFKLLEAEATSKTTFSKEGDPRSYTAYTLGRQHLDYAHRHITKRLQYERAENAISKSQLLAVVSEYESFMADLLKIAIKITPESFISSNQTVNANTIIRGGNLEQIRTSIIEDYITDLQRSSHVDVVKTVFKQLKLNPPDEKSLRDFGEVCLRRNTLTHANGVVNKVYRSEMEKLGFDAKDIPDYGDKLNIDNTYMRRAIARVFLMGYFTGHLVWQHLEKTARDDSVKLIINHSHDFLVFGYTKICGRLCEFGLNSKSPAGEIDRAYLIINLALSYLLNEKLSEDERQKGIENALSKRNWDIVDAKFAMALCCVKEEYENFGQLFDAVKDRDFHVNQFMGLALFTKVRSQPIFKEKMLEHYGVEIASNDEEEEKGMRKDN